eukprot:jgi/Chlat1/6484/Chrsp45S05980
MAGSVSGVTVTDECVTAFLELKRKKAYRFLIYDIKEGKVVLEKKGEPSQSYDAFVACLPENECRYAVYDYDYTNEDMAQKSKIVFVSWTPETAPRRSKMIFASSKSTIKQQLEGIQIELQATDTSEVDIEVFKDRCN